MKFLESVPTSLKKGECCVHATSLPSPSPSIDPGRGSDTVVCGGLLWIVSVGYAHI